jgi:hypothetical protein
LQGKSKKENIQQLIGMNSVLEKGNKKNAKVEKSILSFKRLFK